MLRRGAMISSILTFNWSIIFRQESDWPTGLSLDRMSVLAKTEIQIFYILSKTFPDMSELSLNLR